MAIITKIEIANFFGKGNFVWDLDPQVNILGGKNGSGKSSIFRCCYNLLSGNVNEGEDWAFRDLFDRIRLTFSNGWTLNWKKIPTNTGTYLDYLQKWSEEALTVVDDLGCKRQLDELRENIQAFYLNSFEQSISQALKYEKLPSTQTLEDPLMLDLMIKDQINLRNNLRSKIAEKMYELSKKNPQQGTFKFMDYLEESNKIYTSLSHFLQGYAEPFDSDFIFAKNGASIKFDKLSMGEKQILLILLMVSNTENSPCIFFMDEPDLSMHIDWKEILVTELHKLNPNMQIILSTHAPSVITGWHDRVKEVEQLIRK